jgi:hypothetical protein
MALPIIAAGVAARYGAKKLAKYLVKRNSKKLKKPQNTRKDPDLNLGPGGKSGNALDKRAARNFINKDNKMIGKAKKYIEKNPRKMPDAAEDAIGQSRNYIDNTLSNFSSKARKTVLKSRKR